jgi:hypothetical protein
MNLFRSGEHVRNWNGFKSGTEEGILELSALAKLFSVDIFTKRLDPAYISHLQEYRAARTPVWAEIVKMRPFWLPKAP